MMLDTWHTLLDFQISHVSILPIRANMSSWQKLDKMSIIKSHILDDNILSLAIGAGLTGFECHNDVPFVTGERLYVWPHDDNKQFSPAFGLKDRQTRNTYGFCCKLLVEGFPLISYVTYTHLFFLLFVCCTCSVSRWRPQKVDKRRVLEYTHGLFIT
jgi:hypothetical protein